MKRILTLVWMGVIAFSSYGQYANAAFITSVSGEERMSLAKGSIDVPSWHEKSFWPIYENYLQKAEEKASLSYRSLAAFAMADSKISDKEALELTEQMLIYRDELQVLRKQCYQEIASALNGMIALQFLQTEVLLDMMESSSIYETTSWKNYRFHPKAMTPSQFKAAKQNTISTALSLKPDESDRFWRVYNEYAEECDAILGEDYSMIALYAGDAADFTPALAKRLGQDFLQVIDRESKLKSTYFQKMKDAVGPVLATRFLAWEDYYSLVSKMHAWADAP